MNNIEIYLTDLATNDRLRFPMLPQKINVKTGALFQSYKILAKGDLKLPTGEELTGFQWDGILPGEARKNEPYITGWKDPKEIQSMWSVYRVKKKKLRLLVTETPINHDVYLEKYNVNYSGGYGDYNYNISFIHAKDLIVHESGGGMVVTESGESKAINEELANKPKEQERPKSPRPDTYTVVKGDSLWKIAEKFMGDGSKYPLLYEANKDIFKGAAYGVSPGQVLKILK